jgi:hypothetical protein
MWHERLALSKSSHLPGFGKLFTEIW